MIRIAHLQRFMVVSIASFGLSSMATSVGVAIASSIGITMTASTIARASTAPSAATKIRIGWQVPWATQGQLVQVLKHTDILTKNNLSAEFVGRTFGPELNEAALGGAIDVVLTGDQPAIALLSKNKGWRLIGRLMYNRTVTYVPVASTIQNMRDLRGQTIALPMGAAAERVTREALVGAGLDPKGDVKIVNLDVREQAPLVLNSKGEKTFQQFAALAAFDPFPAIFQSLKLIRPLDVGKVVSVVLMHENTLKSHEQIGHAVMQSLFDAYDYYRQHRKEANEWFLAEAKLANGSIDSCEIAAGLEPNLQATGRSQMRVSLSRLDVADLQKAADFLESIIRTRVDVSQFIEAKATENIK